MIGETSKDHIEFAGSLLIGPFSKAEIDQILLEGFNPGLAAESFDQISPRKWVRSVRAPIRDVFQIHALKGYGFSPAWGFSLDFVPHISGGAVRWHRTPKSTLFDLNYDPMDYTLDTGSWTVEAFMGADDFRSAVSRLAKKSLPAAFEFFSKVDSLDELIDAFEEKRKRPFVRFGFESYVQHPVAFAFTLAKVGRPDKARHQLGSFLRGRELMGSLKERLLRLLAEAGG